MNIWAMVGLGANDMGVKGRSVDTLRFITLAYDSHVQERIIQYYRHDPAHEYHHL